MHSDVEPTKELYKVYKESKHLAKSNGVDMYDDATNPLTKQQ